MYFEAEGAGGYPSHLKYPHSTVENSSLLAIGALLCLIVSAFFLAAILKFGIPKTGGIAFVPLVLSFPVFLLNFRWSRVGSIAMWIITCFTSISAAMAGVLGLEIIPIALLAIASIIASSVDLRSKSCSKPDFVADKTCILKTAAAVDCERTLV